MGEQQDDTLTAGTVLAGKYCVERLLGRGGMGVVYQARHLLLEADVAIKLLTDRDPANIKRFLNEARATAKIRSEHIAQVTDVGTLEGGQPFMVMELLEGRDLDQLLEHRGRLPPAEAVDYVLQALAGLSEAHAAGIVHRDMKPSNVFLVRRGAIDRVKILDFGVAKQLFAGVSTVTSANSVAGSPAYMAPEHLRGEKSIDPRTDIWSVGVILYELVTGHLPFTGDNVGAVFAAILECDPRPPTELAPIDPGLERVILRCLRRKPEERWGSAVELAEALVPFASEEGLKTLELLARSVPTFRASFHDLPRISEPAPPATSLSGVSRTGDHLAETRSSTPGPATTSVAPKRSRGAVAIAAGVMVLAAVGVIAVLSLRSQRAEATRGVQASAREAAPPTTTTTATTATPTTTPAALVTATPTATTSPSTSLAVGTPAGRPRPQPTTKPPASASAAPSAAVSSAPTSNPEDAIFGRH